MSSFTKTKEEKGITLIVLIVTVILLVILTSVVVAQITGDEGIITSTEVATEEYSYIQYKEQIEQLVQGIIMKDSLNGNTTTVTSIAEEILKESWIKSAISNEEAKDIIVTVEKGYMYQVYYDEEAGIQGVENVGTDDGVSLPTLTATYNKENYTITANATSEDGILKIELIYKGEVVQTVNSDMASFEVENMGWYQVKAISNGGKSRIVNVRTSNEIQKPVIAVTSEGAKENDWYGKDSIPVEITISSDEANVTGIYYRLNAFGEYNYIEGKVGTFTINTVGRTVIYAYAVDSRNNESDISNEEIKYDNIKPEVGNLTVNPQVQESGWYNTDIVIAVSNAQDANSGIAGFYYWEVVNSAEVPTVNKIYVKGQNKTLTVTSEGTKTIAIQVVDYAGNVSNTSNITVKKDSIKPKALTINVTNETETGFTINAGTTDDTTMTNDVSGLDRYEVYINGDKVQEFKAEGENAISYTASDLTTNAVYTVYVRVYDKAGNMQESANLMATTGNGGSGQTPGGGEQNPGGGTEGGIDFGDQTEEEINALIGKYVDYTPTEGTFTASTTYSGHSQNQSFSTDKTLKWRIMFVNDDILTLIADNTANPNFWLNGYNGYNNGVLLLNNTCKTTYSNNSLGAFGRNLNINDIEKISSFDKSTYSVNGYSNGKEYSMDYNENDNEYIYYPAIFVQEKTGAPNGTYGTAYGLSDQAGYVNDYGYTSPLYGKMTAYSYTITTEYADSIYVFMLRAGDIAWLSSRCFIPFGFSMFFISNAAIDYTTLYNIWDYNYSECHSLRPVIEIDLSRTVIGEEGNGSEATPYSIRAK